MITLGISCEHDCGVALVQDGKLIAAANEERFIRKKFATIFPYQSIENILSFTGIHPSDIDKICISSNMHIPAYRLDWENNAKFLDVALKFSEATGTTRFLLGTRFGNKITTTGLKWIFNRRRNNDLKENLPPLQLSQKKLSSYNHHYSHACGAIAGSGYDECLVLTLDGSGDALCSIFGIYSRKNGYRELSKIPFFHSPGHYYLYITHIFGYPPGREGKVTGLSARGDYELTKKYFDAKIGYNDDKLRFENKGSYREPEIQRLKKDLKDFSREDISAGLQKNLEDLVVRHLSALSRKHKLRDLPLAVSGGVFANVRLNQTIAELPFISELFVYPHMGDGGLAAGSAWADFVNTHSHFAGGLEDVYLGPSAPSITDSRKMTYPALNYLDMDDLKLAELTAEKLAKMETVAVVRGRMEYGPRALGNRSLLYDATDKSINDWLNKKLSRSEFMPFAPILKEENIGEFFHGTNKVKRCLPFMTTTLTVTKQCEKMYPGIVHIDRTARPQAVSKKTNPFIWNVLDFYEKKSGKKILINTSYNVHEEPIVFNFDEAVKSFVQCGLDNLVYNSCLITHKE